MILIELTKPREASILFVFFFFQAEVGIRDVERSRGLGDVYKRQLLQLRTSNNYGRLTTTDV